MSMKDGKNSKRQLSEENWIVKSNTLNEICGNRMTPTQLRFFTIYLSKINSNDKSTRVVSFNLDEYTRIMNFKQTNITRLKSSAEDLLNLSAAFNEFGIDGNFNGFTVYHIFKLFKLFKSNNEWRVSIDCSDEILPYLFSIKKYYFKYQLWNALRLATVNQLRMYEILKQYELAGAREIQLTDLRSFLGIEPSEYKAFANFRIRVLDSCQKALAENSDIKFTYEQIKKGRGGKITAVKFFIEKNDNYISQLSFDEFIAIKEVPEIAGELVEAEWRNRELYLLSAACNGEFSEAQTELLSALINGYIPDCDTETGLTPKRISYLKAKYAELNYQAERNIEKGRPILNEKRFAYLKKIIEADIREAKVTDSLRLKCDYKGKQSYDISVLNSFTDID